MTDPTTPTPPDTVEVDTVALASASSGFLLTPDISGVYRVIEQVTGIAPYTHQLPRMGRELEAHLKVVLPDFPGQAEAKAFKVNGETYAAYAAALKARWGKRITVPRMTDARPVDPISELAAMSGGKPVIVTAPVEGDSQ